MRGKRLRTAGLALLAAALLGLGACAGGADGGKAQVEALPLLEHKDWAAWINLMPGPNVRPQVYVTGKVQLPMAGQTVRLKTKEQQEYLFGVLVLELDVERQPGEAVPTWYNLRFDESAMGGKYAEADIFYNGRLVAKVPVEEVH